MKTFKNLQKITSPNFLQRLGGWFYRGYKFETSTGKKLAVIQNFIVFGSLGNPTMIDKWCLYDLGNEVIHPNLTSNGVMDLSFWKNPQGKKKRDTFGLSIKEIEEIENYCSNKGLSDLEIREVVVSEIQPILQKEISLIKNSIIDLESLNESQLVQLMKDALTLSSRLKSFYPMSNRKLLELMSTIREKYAKVKYPKLYAEIKACDIHEEGPKVNEDDALIGFGPGLVYGSLFCKYFKSISATNEKSPFEKDFLDFIFFIKS